MRTAIDFSLQDPTVPGRTLLDALADVAHGAERGGAIFAFASAKGIATLLDDPVFEPFTKTAGFELIVGMDAITDERALAVLSDRLQVRPGLSVRVLVHDLPALFHPKLAWFATGDCVTLVVGSGNLTPGGLLNNVEAFTVVTLAGDSGREAERQIAEWLGRWDKYLYAPDASEALARAKQNSGAERSFKKPMSSEDEEPPAVQTGTEDVPEVLLLEIPRNAPRRTQLDVGQAQFQDFFGGEAGKQKRILIQHVAEAGTLDELEPPRALFRTKSDNYRFEAAAGRGVEYPVEGRPIGVFVRMPDGVFRYRLLWPGDAGHREVEAFLTATAGAFVRSMRRETVATSDLLAAWPGLRSVFGAS
jgi:hypothetical protein